MPVPGSALRSTLLERKLGVSRASTCKEVDTAALDPLLIGSLAQLLALKNYSRSVCCIVLHLGLEVCLPLSPKDSSPLQPTHDKFQDDG